jgi:hypothetical protein
MRLQVNHCVTRSIIILCLTACAALVACDREKDEKKESAVQTDTYVEFKSHLGNSFVAPSLFTATDKGDTFSLKSPDGRAIIHAIMYTAEGSGSINEFRETMASGLLPDGATAWKASDWTPIKFREHEAQKRDLIAVPESNQQWRLYVVDGGKFYHAIILNASNETMTLNGDFYENIIRSFHGVRQ